MSARQPDPFDDILGGRPGREHFHPGPSGDEATHRGREGAHDRYANQEVSYVVAPDRDLADVDPGDAMPYESMSLNFEEVRMTVVADHIDVDDDEVGNSILQDGHCEEAEFQ